MKTYSESRGRKPFNWYKELTKINPNWPELEEKAMDWVTCACGNQCDIIPREHYGMPQDYILVALGGDDGFAKAIKRKDVEGALYFLGEIEKRSAYLINQINEQNK